MRARFRMIRALRDSLVKVKSPESGGMYAPPQKKSFFLVGGERVEPAARIRPVSRIYPREVRAWNLAPSLETVWNRITRWICSAILRSKVFGSACNSLPRPSGGRRKSWISRRILISTKTKGEQDGGLGEADGEEKSRKRVGSKSCSEHEICVRLNWLDGKCGKKS